MQQRAMGTNLKCTIMNLSHDVHMCAQAIVYAGVHALAHECARARASIRVYVYVRGVCVCVSTYKSVLLRKCKRRNTHAGAQSYAAS